MAATIRKNSRWEVENEAFRRDFLAKTYHALDMNTTKTAAYLGLNRTHVCKLLNHYGLPRRPVHRGNWE